LAPVVLLLHAASVTRAAPATNPVSERIPTEDSRTPDPAFSSCVRNRRDAQL
jgi:hypothetical protein